MQLGIRLLCRLLIILSDCNCADFDSRGQSYGELLSIRMPLGRVTPIEIQAAARFALASSVASGIDSLVALRVTGRRKISRLLGNNPSEESRSTSPNHGNSRHTSVSSGLSTAYCANFSPDLKKCNCNIHGDQIAVRTSICGVEDKDYRDVMTVQHRQQMQNRSDNEDQSKSLKALKSPEFKRNERRKWRSPCTTFAAVTLITVTSMEEYQAGTLDQMLQSWCGPKV